MGYRQFVGCVRVHPLLQQIVKTSAGGMAAVSAGIVAFFMNGHQPDSPMVLLALSSVAMSIPLLVGSRIFFNIFDSFEYVSVRADEILVSLFTCGFVTALGGYGLLLALVSKVVFWAFFAGMAVAGTAIWRVGKDIDAPQMQRKAVVVD